MNHADASVAVSKPRAFSVAEVLIVAIILAILAALVVPQFSNAADTQRGGALRNEIRQLRAQILLYRVEHNGVAPGIPTGEPAGEPSASLMIAQLTQYTDAQGRVSSRPTAQHKFGPYLQDFPANPLSGDAKIRMVGGSEPFPSEPEGHEGWVYQPRRGIIAPNSGGTDNTGTPFFDY